MMIHLDPRQEGIHVLHYAYQLLGMGPHMLAAVTPWGVGWDMLAAVTLWAAWLGLGHVGSCHLVGCVACAGACWKLLPVGRMAWAGAGQKQAPCGSGALRAHPGVPPPLRLGGGDTTMSWAP